MTDHDGAHKLTARLVGDVWLGSCWDGWDCEAPTSPLLAERFLEHCEADWLTRYGPE